MVVIAQALTTAGIDHALIGGLAVLVRGKSRVTFDIDFLVAAQRREAFVDVLRQLGFEPFHEASAFGNYMRADGRRVDALYARSALGQGMLERACKESLGDVALSVIAAEDLIGLKLQALANDPSRSRDWGDIRGILDLRRDELNMQRVRDYFGLFGFHEELERLLAHQ